MEPPSDVFASETPQPTEAEATTATRIPRPPPPPPPVVPIRGGVIEAGVFVVLEGGVTHVVCKVTPDAKVKLGRLGDVHLKGLIGLPYDIAVQFDSSSKTLVPYEGNPDNMEEPPPTDDGGADNRNLADTSSAQTLRHEEITALKQSEGGVERMVDLLVKSSTTFQTKTSFAQDKYVRKKAAKWAFAFKLRRVSLADLCREGSQNHSKMFFRFDSLALTLNHANIFSSSKVMLYDESNGVLPAAIMQRVLPGDGALYHIVQKDQNPRTHCANQLGLPVRPESWYAVSMESLGAPEWPAQPKGKDCRWRWHDTCIPKLSMSSLIVAAEWSVVEPFEKMFPYLAYSGAFAVFCSVLTPLQDLFFKLRSQGVGGGVVQCSVIDVWTREYQVLPLRTHPSVVLPPTGGYILYGIKVQGANE
eukprot:PhF_6_TR42998/c0_g1_i2/m.65629/K03256/TRM6, GCD10; tRNA (adenine-N(1)-)-methyltransferase non-catalytic subunit